jgi:predicted phage-related endonuclease
MANNFDIIIQEPTSPEREIREISAPPKLRRGDYTRSLTDNKEILLRKYLSAKIEIEKLKTEIMEIYEKLDRHQSLMERVLSEITVNEKD